MKLFRTTLAGFLLSLLAIGSAAAQSVDRGQYNATPPTLADGALGNMQLDANGNLRITGGGSGGLLGTVKIDQTTPGSTNGVNTNPSSAAGIAITPTVSPSAEGSRVFCLGACNAWGIYVTTGAAAGFLMTFNATSAPADGAVTPIECVQVAANSTVALSFGTGPPDRYSTGMTAVYSTTGCFNKTISATAFFKARVSS